MRGLKSLLLYACAAAAALVSAEGIADGLRPYQLKGRVYGDQDNMYIEDKINGALRKRADAGTVNAYCRYWGQSTAMIEDKLYMSGGIATFKENFRDNWIYLYYAAIMTDLSGGLQFPVDANNSVFAYILMGDDGEGTQQGAFWWDGGNYIWKYGGWFASNRTWLNTPQANVRDSDMWRLNLEKSTWEQQSISPSTLHRAWGGAVASVPDKKIGYFLGGIIENRTDTAFQDAPGYLVLQDNFLNYDAVGNSFVNKTASELGHTALGNMVYVAEMGQDGILIYFGGVEGPDGWIPTGSTKGLTLRDLDTIWVYDIKNGRWYSQKTTGTTPKGRISSCAVVVPSQDKSSWNVFMHGGGTLGETTGEVYGDTWVLTLPSFQWMLVDSTGDKKFEHTCHLVKGNQLLVIGGRDKQQEFSGDPANNYSMDARDWSCARNGIFNTLNLNTFNWGDSLPAQAENYEVNTLISSIIGGSASGNADVLAPLNDWSDAGLKSVMFISPVNTNSTTSTTSSSKKSTPTGAIIGGVVGGVVLIALIAVGIILLRRGSNSQDPALDAAAPVTQVAQPPPTEADRLSYYPGSPAPQYYQQPQGYIWDPLTQQYYLPGSPPPQSPGHDGYYAKPPQPLAPVEAPADVPAAIPPSELPANT